MSISIGVAVTGICGPIGLSFVLERLLEASPLQAFAAGAALCSTSLGTTFAILSACGLQATRLGSVLTTAAMLDDIVGLVMVQVISSLVGDGYGLRAPTIIRPVLVSVAFVVLIPLACWLVLKPLAAWLKANRNAALIAPCFKLTSSLGVTAKLQTLVLTAFVVGGSYAGTSNLFTAYLAGVSSSWWHEQLRKPVMSREGHSHDVSNPRSATNDVQSHNIASAVKTYEKYYRDIVMRILKPFFFASIGFSIPIAQMFSGANLWRDILYTALMMLGKLVCSLWLIRSPRLSLDFFDRWQATFRWLGNFLRSCALHNTKKAPAWQATHTTTETKENSGKVQKDTELTGVPQVRMMEPRPHDHGRVSRPTLLYPAAILGSAMVARGKSDFSYLESLQAREYLVLVPMALLFF